MHLGLQSTASATRIVHDGVNGVKMVLVLLLKDESEEYRIVGVMVMISLV